MSTTAMPTTAMPKTAMPKTAISKIVLSKTALSKTALSKILLDPLAAMGLAVSGGCQTQTVLVSSSPRVSHGRGLRGVLGGILGGILQRGPGIWNAGQLELSSGLLCYFIGAVPLLSLVGCAHSPVSRSPSIPADVESSSPATPHSNPFLSGALPPVPTATSGSGSSRGVFPITASQPASVVASPLTPQSATLPTGSPSLPTAKPSPLTLPTQPLLSQGELRSEPLQRPAPTLAPMPRIPGVNAPLQAVSGTPTPLSPTLASPALSPVSPTSAAQPSPLRPVSRPAAPTPAPVPPAVTPKPPAATGIEVTGIVQIQDDYRVLLRESEGSSSKSVRIGDRLVNGTVKVQRLELVPGQPAKVVLLENGKEFIHWVSTPVQSLPVQSVPATPATSPAQTPEPSQPVAAPPSP